jgi:hypothetical protein
MSEVFFEILSPLPLNSQGDARRLFKIWAESAPRFFPDRWGRYEPLKEKLSPTSVDEAIRRWEFQFLLKRIASPKLEGNVFMQYGPHRQHSNWTITLQRLADFDSHSFGNLLRNAATAFLADFAFLHCVTDAEIPRGIKNDTIGFLNTSRTEKSLFVTTHILKRYIPDIYWMTVFGAPYVKLFTRKKLLSAPAYRVEELENGAILVQLTPNLSDTRRDERAFESVRKTVRDHLNSGAIFDERKGAQFRYAVPDFTWHPALS